MGNMNGGVRELKCPEFSGEARDYVKYRRTLHTWSLIGPVHPAMQGPTARSKLTGTAEQLVKHLRDEELLFPGGLLEIVRILDSHYAKEADSTRFSTFEEAFDAPVKRTDETLLACMSRVRLGVEKARRMGIQTDHELEGYLVLKKLNLSRLERLTVMTFAQGSHDVDQLQLAVKRMSELLAAERAAQGAFVTEAEKDPSPPTRPAGRDSEL